MKGDCRRYVGQIMSEALASGTAPALSVVVPVRNEAGNIAPLVEEIAAALDRHVTFEVIFVNDDSTSLQRTPAPAQLPASNQFKACSLGFASEMTLTQHPELDVPNFDWTDEEQQKYENLLSTFPDFADHAAIHHRLLGNPDAIQNDMRQECQLASHGISVTDIDYSDPRIAELSKGDKDWHLLLQIDSDEHAGMRWGNSGMIYYWIKEEDLQAHRFDAVWLVLQSE